jgi:cbb3-type cytochrome oxidase subunit 3
LKREKNEGNACNFQGILSGFFFFMFAGIADGSSGAKNGTMKPDKHAASTNNTGIPKIAIIFVSMVAIGFLAFFLFKFWQKKKREEQYARLLKLFEEDDELEVELGLRD